MPLLRDPSLRDDRARRPLQSPDPKTLGAWELVRSVYQGPWSGVFQARPIAARATPADYALKLASESNRLAITMLQQQAWLGARIAHAHLAPVLASHVEAPPFYCVMPWLEGESLGELHRQGQLSVSSALWIARQTCEALAALHGQGWRHADVKPENIQVGLDGHATLLDLGFAAPLEPRIGNDSYAFQGTLRYAAPELLAAPALPSAASDVYSVGVVLYELLAGRPPFDEFESDALAAAILYQTAVPLKALRPELPSSVCQLVQRMLARQALRRPLASEAAEQLARCEIECFEELG